MRPARLLAFALSLGALACAADPEPHSAPDEVDPRAPVAPDVLAPAPEEAGAAGAELGAGYRPLYRFDEQRQEMVSAWDDPTEGPTATLVYVTRAGGRGEKARPAAVVFSSDPANAHFRRDTTPRITVRRLYRKEMALLLQRLEQEGLGKLPWEEQEYDADIGPERALYLYQKGKRRRAVKEQLPPGDMETFTDIEREVIEVTLGR